MAKYCKVTNVTTRVCSTTVQTQYYKAIRLLPGEEIYIREEVCNKAGLEAVGFLVEEFDLPNQDDIAFGEAHDRIVNAIYEDRLESGTSWLPENGYPTWESVGYEFPPGTRFEAYGAGIIPGDPIPVEIYYRQQIQNCVRNPDGVTNSQWKVLPRDSSQLITGDQLQDALDGIGQGGGGTESPNYFQQFLAVDFVGGVLSIPLTTHNLPFTSGRPYEVEVYDDQGAEVWVCTATNPVTGEVTITTDGVSFPGSIIISES